MHHPLFNIYKRIIAISASLLFAFSAQAIVIPVGVQQNVAVNTVTNDWGWSVVYQGTYAAGAPISTVFNGVESGDYVMYAARPTGSSTFTLLAAAIESDVRNYTAQNVTTTSNGAEWYYNGGSIGFAGLGDVISQSSADTQSVNADLRLSWHTQVGGNFNQYASMPETLAGGWRAGATTSLNSSTAWERFVLVIPAAQVPEPSAYALIAGMLAFVSVAIRRRR